MHDDEWLPVVEYLVTPSEPDETARVFHVLPGDPSYDEYLGHISEGWCPPDGLPPGPTRLRPVFDVRTRERWAVCGHELWWRLRSPAADSEQTTAIDET